MEKEVSYISFENLKDKLFKPDDTIKDFDNYYGHIRENSNGKIEEIERLQEHIEKVDDYFLQIIETYNLEKLIDEHIDRIKNIFNYGNRGAEFIKLLFFEAVNFHDVGKINPNFQAVIMKNKKFKKENSSLGTNHSMLSVYLFYAYMVQKLYKYFDEEDRVPAYVLVLLFSVVIRKHHASEISNPFYYFEYLNDNNKNRLFEDIKMDDLTRFLEVSKIIESKQSNEDKKRIIKKLVEDIHKIDLSPFKEGFISRLSENPDSFPVYSLLKLNFSLLTTSDYLATASFMLDTKIPVEGIIDGTLRKNIYNRFYKSTKWNKRLNKKDGSEKPKDFAKLNKRSNNNLNELRYKILYETREVLNKNINKNLFYLEAPTGVGKTNISFMAVAELLKNRKELNKVFYVFPFTTLVTQTKESTVKAFGLKEKDYIELHSRADFKDNEKNYGKEWKNFIDYQFVNYPITLLTHIRFFDIIKSNKKDDNYLYHKLSNSIVVIDEIQAYPPDHWNKIYYFIKNVSESFNTVFIIMSATLPKLHKLLELDDASSSPFVYLNEHKEEYFRNPNFSERAKFEFIETKDLNDLKEKIKVKAKEYNERNHWVLVEFIYKRSASEFFRIVNEDEHFVDYKKYLLSGTILEPVRKKIINELKTKREDEGYKKVILISTQVVEAGIDLDFDIGFKDTSIIDSDEQLAGRINRNALRSNCKVYLFNYDRKDKIYGRDLRYKIQKQKLDSEQYKDYLLNKDFDGFYEMVINYIKQIDKSESRFGIKDYEDIVRNLNFTGVHNEFKLIDQDTISVFVNVEYDLNKYNITIDNEFKFLVKDNKLKGENVWKKYCEVIENKNTDFTKRKENIVKIQALMSNFVFSMFRPSSLTKELESLGIEKYGYLYIEDIEDIYSLENGLNERRLKKSSIWII